MNKTYEIVASKDGKQAGIKCLDCNLTSWNYNDVREKYCGNCHEFHEQKERKLLYPHLFKQTKEEYNNKPDKLFDMKIL